MWENLQILAAAPVFNLQLVLNGLSVGAVFALVAYGLQLVWGVTSVKNLAQGDFVMLGGYVAWELSRHGVHPIYALVPTAAILFVLGWNQYLWPLLVTTDPKYYTVVMGIKRMAEVADSFPQWNIVMAGVVLAMLPPVVVVILMQRLFVKGLVETEK